MAEKGKKKRKLTDKRKDPEDFERVRRTTSTDAHHLLQGSMKQDASMLARLSPMARERLGYEAFPSFARWAANA